MSLQMVNASCPDAESVTHREFIASLLGTALIDFTNPLYARHPDPSLRNSRDFRTLAARQGSRPASMAAGVGESKIRFVGFVAINQYIKLSSCNVTTLSSQ
jgi:hypothetical protein